MRRPHPDIPLPMETLALARHLPGCILRRSTPRGHVSGIILETEAYTQDDPASHSHRGRTPRNASMFLPPFHAYVYRSYGMHFCVNISSGPEGVGEAVLIRALKPLEGVEFMRTRRGGVPDRRLAEGPGNLCAALGIDATLDGHDLAHPPLQLIVPERHIPLDTDQTPRVGITRGTERYWRFRVAWREPGSDSIPGMQRPKGEKP